MRHYKPSEHELIGDVQSEPLAFTRVAIPYIQVLFSGIPIEQRPEVIRNLQNTIYSPQVTGLLAPNVDLTQMSLRDAFKVWNAYQSLLLSVLAEFGRDELIKRFKGWGQIFGKEGLPEDILKSILENTDYSELVPTGQGDLTYGANERLPSVLLDPEYQVGLKHIAAGGRFDDALRSLADAMAYEEMLDENGHEIDSEFEGGPKKKEKRVQARANKKAAHQVKREQKVAVKAVKREAKKAGVPIPRAALKAMRAAPIKVSTSPTESQVNNTMKAAKVGRSIRLLGKRVRESKIANLTRSLPPNTVAQIVEATLPKAEVKPITEVKDVPKVYDIPQVGIIATDLPIKDELIEELGATPMVDEETFEDMQDVNEFIDENAPLEDATDEEYEEEEGLEEEGDLTLPDLLMIGHQLEALLRLTAIAGSKGIGERTSFQDRGRSGSVMPSGPLFQAGDIAMGELMISQLQNDPHLNDYLNNVGDATEGDIYEGILPLLAAAAMPVAKFGAKIIGKTAVGKAIGGAAKKGAGAAWRGVKNVGGKIFRGGKKAAKSTAGAVAGTIVAGVGADALLDAYSAGKSEKAVDKPGQEGPTTFKSVSPDMPSSSAPTPDRSERISEPDSVMTRNFIVS